MSVKGDLSEFNKMAGEKINHAKFLSTAFNAGYKQARIIYPGQVAEDETINKNRINAIVDTDGKVCAFVFG